MPIPSANVAKAKHICGVHLKTQIGLEHRLIMKKKSLSINLGNFKMTRSIEIQILQKNITISLEY